jgi:hypothetical protein
VRPKSISSHVSGKAYKTIFLNPDGRKQSGSSFSLEFGRSSIRETQVIPAPQGALGESGGNESAGNVEKTSRAADGPDLSARKVDRRPHRIVFRAL